MKELALQIATEVGMISQSLHTIAHGLENASIVNIDPERFAGDIHGIINILELLARQADRLSVQLEDMSTLHNRHICHDPANSTPLEQPAQP